MKTTVATIDFGTSKIVTLVAENSGSQRCDIIAAGVAKYDGYLDEGWNNPASTRTIIVQTMHERKAKIADLAEAMVALPGGIGTFEELLECLTWKQLGLHTKPVVILNTCGYYDTLLAAIDRMVAEHFIRPVHKEMFAVVNTAEEVIPALLNAKPWDKSTRRDAAI